MARILVTGSRGFTGRYMSASLRARSHDVRGLVRPRAGVASCGADEHACDLTDAVRVHEVVRRVMPQRVVHLAAVSQAGHQDPVDYYRVNLIGTRHILDALAGLPARPRRVLPSSTAAVDGQATVQCIDESTPVAPVGEYAISKAAMEQVAGLWLDRLPITVVRPFNYTGVGQSENYVVPKIVAAVRRREPVLRLGNVRVQRDFQDVRTVVECHVRLVESDAARRVLNVCSGDATSIAELVGLAGVIVGHVPGVEVDPRLVRANDDTRLVGSTAALESAIGPMRRRPLRDTLEWMLG
jgi:nucleoside-diphosphate-sugar epimerase